MFVQWTQKRCKFLLLSLASTIYFMVDFFDFAVTKAIIKACSWRLAATVDNQELWLEIETDEVVMGVY